MKSMIVTKFGMAGILFLASDVSSDGANKLRGKHRDFTSRIVGGEDADQGEFNFMVSWDGDNCGKYE